MMEDEKLCPVCGNRSAERKNLTPTRYVIVCPICGYRSEELPVSIGKDVV